MFKKELFSHTDRQPGSTTELLDRMQADKVPGVSIAVIDGGELAWAGGYGVLAVGSNSPVTIDTLFQACSLSKPIAAMAALSLVQEGKLDLDENVNQKLTSWQVPENEFTKDEKVTLRRLLTHTAGLTVSGFRGYAADEQVPALHQILDGLEPANSLPIRVDTIPGTQWRYSGGGFTVLQQLLIDVTGKPFPELMQELVFEKLGMAQSSTYQQPHLTATHLKAEAACAHDETEAKVNGDWFTYPEMAAAGLWTTPSDVARVAIELQKSKAGPTNTANRVLSAEMTNQMLSDQMEDFPVEMVSQRYSRQIRNQGLGFRLEGALTKSVGPHATRSRRFSHHGGNMGYRCFIVAYSDREAGQGAVVMTNSDNGAELIQGIVRSIAQEHGWLDYPLDWIDRNS